MIPVSEAIEIIDREATALPSEAIDLVNAVSRVLAEDIIADSDLPPFHRSQMDGYAVVAADTKETPVKLRIAGESAAGRGWYHKLKKGEAVRIMTGAPMPEGADAVQKIELSTEDNGFVEIREPTEKGRFIIKKGAEIEKGAVVIKSGEIVTENMIAVLAAFGYAKVKVARKPVVSILSTGNEIVPVDEVPGTDQIRNSNSVMLRVFSEKAGATAFPLPIAPDDLDDLKAQILTAVESSDVLVMTGGVSVGKYDLTKTALSELGAEVFFEKVRLKPGKPTVFARLHGKLVFGLPGNPVSVAATFHLFVRRALLLMQGATTSGLKAGNAITGSKIKGAKERDTYLPAKLSTNNKGKLVASSIRWLGSSDFVGFARSDAFVFVPAGISFESGDLVSILHLP